MKLALILLIPMALCFSVEASAQETRFPDCALPVTSKLTVNVRDTGAKGDGLADDTAAIQKAIDRVATKGGTVLVPEGVYMVNAVAPAQLALKSRMILKLSPRATLRAISNGDPHYSILTISGVSHVAVVGGTLEGDRDHHQGRTGEW